MDAMGKGLGGSYKTTSRLNKFYSFFIGRFHDVEWYKNVGKMSMLPTVLYQKWDANEHEFFFFDPCNRVVIHVLLTYLHLAHDLLQWEHPEPFLGHDVALDTVGDVRPPPLWLLLN